MSDSIWTAEQATAIRAQAHVIAEQAKTIAKMQALLTVLASDVLRALELASKDKR